MRKKNRVGRREAKRLEKEKQAVYLKRVEGLKPRDIAKKLRMGIQDVYKADQRLKTNYMKAKAGSEGPGLDYFYS